MTPQNQPTAPVMMPFIYPPQQQQEMRVLDSHAIPNIAPVRISAAFDFVAYMGHRMTPLVAVDNMGAIQKEDKPPLTGGEKAAFDAACQCLCDYFNGSLDPDVLEKQRVTGNSFELIKRHPGMIRTCPECLGRRENGVGVPCMSCGTMGKVVMVPVGDDPVEPTEAQVAKRGRKKRNT